MKIKGKVSRTFHSMDNGFKIIVLELSKNSGIPEKYRNPDYPTNVSVVGNLKNVQDEYVVEITGEWEHRESGRYWPWQFMPETEIPPAMRGDHYRAPSICRKRIAS